MAVQVAALAAEMVHSTQGRTLRATHSINRLARRLGSAVAYDPGEVLPTSIIDIVYSEVEHLTSINRRRSDVDVPVAASILLFDEDWRVVARVTGVNRREKER